MRKKNGLTCARRRWTRPWTQTWVRVAGFFCCHSSWALASKSGMGEMGREGERERELEMRQAESSVCSNPPPSPKSTTNNRARGQSDTTAHVRRPPHVRQCPGRFERAPPAPACSAHPLPRQTAAQPEPGRFGQELGHDGHGECRQPDDVQRGRLGVLCLQQLGTYIHLTVKHEWHG